jgi:V/A-type H+-transporting ATPase subunit C
MAKKTKRIKDTDYLFLSARLRALESTLLSSARMERMLDAPSVEDAARVLAECGYAELNRVDVDAVDRMLSQARDELMEELGDAALDGRMVDVFKVKYDYHNAKVLLKSEAKGEDASRLLVEAGRVPAQTLSAAFASGETEALPPALAQAIAQARELLNATKDPQQSDLLLDRAYFAELLHLAQETGSDFLTGYIRLQLDTANLRSAVRVLRMGKDSAFLGKVLFQGGSIAEETIAPLADGSGSLEELYVHTPLEQAAAVGAQAVRGGSLTEFEKACDNALVAYLSEAKRVPFGEQPLIAYLAARDSEQTAIRIILTGRLAGLPADVIRERLRDCYV